MGIFEQYLDFYQFHCDWRSMYCVCMCACSCKRKPHSVKFWLNLNNYGKNNLKYHNDRTLFIVIVALNLIFLIVFVNWNWVVVIRCHWRSLLHLNFLLFSKISVCFTICVIICAWIHKLDYLCVCSCGRERVCERNSCLLYS